MSRNAKAIIFCMGLAISLSCRPAICEPVKEAAAAANPPQAQEPQKPTEWLTLKSNYFTIYYRPGVNLKLVARRLSTRRFYANWLTGRAPSDTSEEKVAYNMDLLLARVQDLLDMRPPKKMRLKLRIFKDSNELYDEYHRIVKKREEMPAFYVYKYDTIYTSEEEISDSVIAHEIGHAIVDHYFVIPPPEKVREMLAQYVDLHLDEE